MVMIIFWLSYTVLFLGLVMWVAEHPLSVGGSVLFLYMAGSALVSLSVSFVVGVFLFLTGVSGMMVAFLYVVALCPNPVFIFGGESLGYMRVVVTAGLVGLFLPFVGLALSVLGGVSLEVSCLVESSQWMRDPSMWGGLAELMPFLGVLLFLCMVSVVLLCGGQKQCLGGHDLALTKRDYS